MKTVNTVGKRIMITTEDVLNYAQTTKRFNNADVCKQFHMKSKAASYHLVKLNKNNKIFKVAGTSPAVYTTNAKPMHKDDKKMTKQDTFNKYIDQIINNLTSLQDEFNKITAENQDAKRLQKTLNSIEKMVRK